MLLVLTKEHNGESWLQPQLKMQTGVMHQYKVYHKEQMEKAHWFKYVLNNYRLLRSYILPINLPQF